MEHQITYKIHSVDKEGLSLVEYTHSDFGSVQKYLHLPIEKDEKAVKQAILFAAPRSTFRARARAKQDDAAQNASRWIGTKGSLNITFFDNKFDAIVDLETEEL